jgi:ppGpp synthetase/RelA/SpoT-type nucleotidyltranferase
VKAPAGLLEIQIRTLSQSHWANLYETVGDLLGREVRYIDAADGPAGEVLSQLWKFSADAYENEKNWVVAQELVERTKALTENEKLSDDQLAEARQLVEEVAAIRHRLARQITEQVEYFAQQRGKLEKLRDTQSKEERS